MDYNWHHDYPQIARDSGFKLRQIKDGALNWRLLGSVEVEKLVANQNFERIDSLVTHISEAPLGTILDSNILDSGIVKYFNLAQLSIQYLLFCKKFLDETLTSLRDSLHEIQAENTKLKRTCHENNDELLQLHKKMQRVEAINQVLFPCTMCTKNFVSNEMLDTHIKRKHSKIQLEEKSSTVNDKNLINTIKLELEIKHLKERLNTAEKEIKDHQCLNKTDNKSSQVEYKETLEVMKEKKSIGTQCDIKMQSIGIQSNLEEPKETDEIVDFERKEQSNILNDLQQKLITFEDLKKAEMKENEKTTEFLKTKLDEILNSVEKKLTLINENKNSITDTTTPPTNDNLIDIQRILIENMSKIYEESQVKLNETVKKLEKGYEDKLQSLERLLKKYETISKQSSTPIGDSAHNIDLNDDKPATSMEAMASVENIHPSLDIIRSEEITPTPRFATSITRSNTFVLSSDESIESSSVKDVITNSPLPAIVQVHSLHEKEMEHPAHISQTIINRVIPNPNVNKQYSTKLVAKRLKALGITPKTKYLSKSYLSQISDALSEKRYIDRKKYPKYFVTRNKLRHMVEKISKERLEELTKEIPRDTNQLKTKIVVDTNHPTHHILSPTVESDSDQSNLEETTSIHHMASTTSTTFGEVTHEKQNLDHFKARLEQILASPIRKPIKPNKDLNIGHQSHSTPKHSPTTSEGSIKKPVPTPRKKVMFDIDSENKTLVHEVLDNIQYQPSKMYESDISSLSSM